MLDSKNRITVYAEKVQKMIDAGGNNGALSTQEQRDAFEKEIGSHSSRGR